MSKRTPQDRGNLITEQRLQASADLDSLETSQVLELINAQDATVPAAVKRAIPAITKLVEAAAASLSTSGGGGGRLIYAGAGTSGRLGVLDASECPPTFYCDPRDVVGIIAGGDSALRRSVEHAEDDPAGIEPEFERLKVNERDTFVAIAAGGTTPYCWGAIERAKKRGCVTGLICCVKVADLSDELPKHALDHAVELIVGPEVVTGSTRMKAGTATKLALNMLTTATMVRLGKVWGNLMIDLRVSNDKLIDRALRIITKQTNLDRFAAAALLHQAEGSVKRALVMARLHCDCAEADEKLRQSDGKLRPLLGPPR
ncbi:MAG: N-acetylmuramic acid 6-phosphate etherase [Phycisphaeraceae bacterium]|nr:N-acetylmuramic acid 6-phosphate etherase [Phycisphaeraceae bacterium]